jgi:nardilysin
VAGLIRQQYSAERMCLAVLGGEPLDRLQAWVGELFDSVPSGKGPRPSFADAGMPYEVGC